MRIEYTSSSPDETMQFGRKIGSALKGGEVFVLQGTLAAGKTTITKGIAAGLGVGDAITSPTFCLVSEYEGRFPLCHMDVYRLDGAEDFVDVGALDMLQGNNVCLIEWGEKVMEQLPAQTIVLKIEMLGDAKRKISVENWPHGDIR